MHNILKRSTFVHFKLVLFIEERITLHINHILWLYVNVYWKTAEIITDRKGR